MAVGGAKPKPAALRVVDGTHRKDRHGDAETAAKVEKKLAKLDRPPTWLKNPARKRWKYILGHVNELGVARKLDEVAVAMMCEALQDYLEACETLETFGKYYTTTTQAGDEMVRPHPALAEKKQAETRLMKLCPEFGMTPSARARLGAALEAAEDDPSEKYFS